MTLVKWSPAREFENITRDMERIFEDTLEPFGRRRWWAPKLFEHDVIVPKVDMYDKKNEVVVKAELPDSTRRMLTLPSRMIPSH